MQELPQDVLEQAEACAKNDWILLLQIDSFSYGDLDLMFGDDGKLYFCIKREDLLEKRFDKAWMQLQCY